MPDLSVIATANSEYYANLDYDSGGGSLSKAEAFKNAVRALMNHLAADSAKGASSIRFKTEQLQAELAKVENWIAVNSTSHPAVTVADFRNLRS